jgi:hypothetical protein
VLWLFGQTDMAAARGALGGRACIGGKVPSALDVARAENLKAMIDTGRALRG